MQLLNINKEESIYFGEIMKLLGNNTEFHRFSKIFHMMMLLNEYR